MGRKRKVVGVVGGLAAGTAAVAWLARQRQPTSTNGDDRPVDVPSRAQRTAKIAGLSSRAGADFALHRAKRKFASVDKQAQLDAQFELRTAEHVAEALGNMKGALMKLGQMASYLDTGLPEPVREALSGLQQDAPPMSAGLAAEAIERELGAPPDEVFLEWDPTPMASASIGQVHRAITRDEQAVAVKIQYPGIADAVRSDLSNAGLLFGSISMMFPGLEPGPLIQEIRERVSEELDYELEARNQQLFADYYRDHPFIHVPDVVGHLSTSRVLTTELAEGVRFDEMTTWSQDERNLAAEAIYRFVFRSLYDLHAFNGDPHPGNYLFRPGGQVTFLDFGLVKHFTPPEIDLLGRMTKAMAVERNLPAYRTMIAEAGLLAADAPFTDEHVEEYFGHFYSFILESEVVTITPEWSSETLSRFFDPAGPHGEIAKQANIPPGFVIIQRINLGLMAILGDLQATANFRSIAEELWPWYDRTDSSTTDLGEKEAAWLANRA
jgi:predicted unusual protein kinase regulating ubiquinone biosynthesis (AarF/ABC1/UbiB family)